MNTASDISDTAKRIRIATRASNLALWQARTVQDALISALPQLHVELVEITTSGDQNQIDPLRVIGAQGVFTREVQKAVLDGRADVAVHSLKDLPTEATPGLTLGAVLERGAVDDVLVLPHRQAAPNGLGGLPEQARVGTGSPRRQAQLLHQRPDLRLEEIRGNVETRLRKLDDGAYDAIVLAAAGLERLELADRISARLSPPIMFPAVSQGIVGIECREDDTDTQTALASIHHAVTGAAATAERALLRTLRAGCHAPLGVATDGADDTLTLTAVVLSRNGSERILAEQTESIDRPEELGEALARKLIDQGAMRLIDAAAE